MKVVTKSKKSLERIEGTQYRKDGTLRLHFVELKMPDGSTKIEKWQYYKPDGTPCFRMEEAYTEEELKSLGGANVVS